MGSALTKMREQVVKALPKRRGYWARSWPLYVMFLPALIWLFLFCLYPFYGRIVAFQAYNPALGFSRSPWVGLDNFRYAFSLPSFPRLVRNTVVIALSKMLVLEFFAITASLLLNEIRLSLLKRTVQSLLYIPYFLSWVVMAGIILDILSPQGLVDQFLRLVAFKMPFLLGDSSWFVFTLVSTHVWKSLGWSMILYLAALTAIDPGLYEAAAIDGANRWRRILHVTLPGMSTTVILIACLNFGNILSAGFEQILNLYNPIVYDTGDILDTYIYRAGLISARFGLAGAIDLFKGVIGFALVLISRRLASRLTGRQVI